LSVTSLNCTLFAFVPGGASLGTSRLFGLGEADRNESYMAVTCREEIRIGGDEFLTAVGHRSQNTNV
jgi:hypothetical protein